MNEHVVLALAFLASVIFLFKPAARFLRTVLSSYANNIDKNLEEALYKKEEADSALMNSLQKIKNINEETNRIILEAKNHAETLKTECMKDTEEMFNQKIEYITCVLSNNIKVAFDNVRDDALNIAAEAVKQVIGKNYTQDKEYQKNELMDTLDELRKKIN